MLAPRLNPGDTIGLICPSHIGTEENYRRIADAIGRLGFGVKFGANIFKDTDGYLASVGERADDLNQMVADDGVKMILFGGGWGASELLPFIDYENIRRRPKLFCSYSDGTSILNAVHARTGLVTYYGPGANDFQNLLHDDYLQFAGHFVAGGGMPGLSGRGRWQVVSPGDCEGTLIGGYTLNFALLMGGDFFRCDPGRRYLLFLEDNREFSGVAAVSVYLSHVEQSPFIRQVSGLIFGHYADKVPPELIGRLRRFGEAHGVPVVYCDDFGHYTRHAILPIGVPASLCTREQTLTFRW